MHIKKRLRPGRGWRQARRSGPHRCVLASGLAAVGTPGLAAVGAPGHVSVGAPGLVTLGAPGLAAELVLMLLEHWLQRLVWDGLQRSLY